ncbi:hypothetical protein R3X27_23450 [Tropicimonas sp. TH_r6]|nr:hypothetical protein [Tropicimonas sp. TH_r6]MDV7145650.1 hypothetical protein [Tropicimonas sp. TH_r6]
MTSSFNEDLAAVAVVGIDIGKDVFHLVGFDGEPTRRPDTYRRYLKPR